MRSHKVVRFKHFAVMPYLQSISALKMDALGFSETVEPSYQTWGTTPQKMTIPNTYHTDSDYEFGPQTMLSSNSPDMNWTVFTAAV
jgi:hypothetical protein